MRDGWSRVPLGSLTTQTSTPVAVRDDREYVSLGLRMYGGGVFAREAKNGSEIKAARLFAVRPGQFIYNRLFASGGSFGLVRPEHEGAVVSNEFPLFDLDESRLIPEYLYLYFQQPLVWEVVAAQCIGTTKTRLRWKEERFSKYEMPLPSLVEQRRIVDLIAALDDTIQATHENAKTLAHVLAARRDAVFRGSSTVPAPDMFLIVQGLQRSPTRAEGPHQTPYLRSANVLNGSLDLTDVKTMSFDPTQQEKYRLLPGDVLVTEGSASAAAVGAPAEYHGELEGTVCFQNTLLRYRAIPGTTTPAYVSQWCSWAYESGAFREAANGTNIKHIGSGGASRMMVANVPLELQPEITADTEAAQSALEEATRQATTLQQLRSNLLTALLSGEHEIPASYDDLIAEAPARLLRYASTGADPAWVVDQEGGL